MTAGDQIRADLNAQLARASAESGRNLCWTEQELVVIARAAKAADRCEVLDEMWAAEAAGDRDVSRLTRLSAEARLLEKQIVVLVERLSPAAGPVKSLRHQKAAMARYNRPRPVA